MANNDTDVPRCPICGKYMEKQREGGKVVVYECCTGTKAVPKPEFQTGAAQRRMRRI